MTFRYKGIFSSASKNDMLIFSFLNNLTNLSNSFSFVSYFATRYGYDNLIVGLVFSSTGFTSDTTSSYFFLFSLTSKSTSMILSSNFSSSSFSSATFWLLVATTLIFSWFYWFPCACRATCCAICPIWISKLFIAAVVFLWLPLVSSWNWEVWAAIFSIATSHYAFWGACCCWSF